MFKKFAEQLKNSVAGNFLKILEIQDKVIEAKEKTIVVLQEAVELGDKVIALKDKQIKKLEEDNAYLQKNLGVYHEAEKAILEQDNILFAKMKFQEV